MATASIAGRRPIASIRRDPTAVWRHVDASLLVLVMGLAAFGVLMVYSATRGDVAPYSTEYLVKQIFFLVLGVVAGGVAMFIDYRRILDRAPVFYAISIILLLALQVVGSRQKGAQGWFALGPFNLQPSELAKIALILAFSYVASQFHGDIDLRRLASLLGMAGLPMVLVFLQPDLGTALVSLAITFMLLSAAGVRGRYLAALAIGGILFATFVVGSPVLDQYQKDRLTSFVTQDKSDLTTEQLRGKKYWNLEQSKVAIGSGGLRGKGLFNGPQTNSNAVPEQHTDFIFTAVGEQLGLVGAGLVLSVYGFLCWRIWRTAQLARDNAGNMICLGVLAWLLFQVFENVGMTMGIMPITGIPLPWMSYGGSSTITACIMIGLVLNVGMRRFR